MEAGRHDFVLLDVHSAEAFAGGHVPGAMNLPHGRINERNLEAYPAETLDRNGALLSEHKVFMSIGHDEYWSSNQRSNVETHGSCCL